MTLVRQAVLAAVAARIRDLPRPARVAVDGVTAAGKSTFADELTQLVVGAERATIDDFHRPPPQEYYPTSFDFERFRAHVLSLRETTIVDGVFLHYPDLRDLWDLTIFLAVDRDVALERALARATSRGWRTPATGTQRATSPARPATSPRSTRSRSQPSSSTTPI